jgi:uncharacterized protein YaiL (DUF2058 family)
MGNLRDEMLKKGIISEKRARAVTHEEKARQKRLGADQVEEERRAREEAARREVEARREADRRREEERRGQHEKELTENRIPGLIRLGLVREGAVGNRRFYFITRENTVSFIEVSDGAMRGLTDGRVAIVEACGVVRQDFCLVAAEQAQEIAKIDPACVRFVNAAVAGR